MPVGMKEPPSVPPPDPAYLESRSHTPRGTQRRNVPSSTRPPPQTDIFDDMAGVSSSTRRTRRPVPAHQGSVIKKVAAQALTVLFKLVHDLFIDDETAWFLKKYTPERLVVKAGRRAPRRALRAARR